jgi:uncharacterized protein
MSGPARVTGGCEISINGTAIIEGALDNLVTDSDLDQPDMATITLDNSNDPPYSQSVNQGDAVVIKMADEAGTGEPIFQGEIVGVEPIFEAEGKSRVVLRAFNRLHRLSRGKKSKTYENMSDTDIASQIAGQYSLSAKTTSDVNIKHKHVYQHNQTDLEFLLARAARIDYEVLCIDKELHFRKRDTSVDSGFKLELGNLDAQMAIKRFTPRLSTAGLVQEVNVRAWNPLKREIMVGKATAVGNKLGGKDGAAQAQSPFSKVLYYDVDIPCFSVEEANAIAKSKLEEAVLNFITGDVAVIGDAKLKAGIVVTIDITDARFKGKYYVTGCSHRFNKAGKGAGGGGGYITMLRVRRNAET